MFPRGFKSKCEKIAKDYREKLALNPKDPINPFKLAEYLKISVCTANDLKDLDEKSKKTLLIDDPNSWSAVTISWQRDYLIVLNPTHSGGRTNSNLTHELSHLIIGHSPARVDLTEDEMLILDTYDKGQEDEADWLSGCLLLPREALLDIKRKKISENLASEKYGVSRKMLEYRMNITGVSFQNKWIGA